MTWFRDYLAWALNRPLVKVLVIFIFGLYLAGALYGLTNIKEGLDRRRLSKDDSYSITFYDREEAYYREFPYRIQVSCVLFNIKKRLDDQLKSEGIQLTIMTKAMNLTTIAHVYIIYTSSPLGDFYFREFARSENRGQSRSVSKPIIAPLSPFNSHSDREIIDA